ncbi:hypothetical protein JCM1840_003656 [Sporobolomyces johnsonii]
MSDESFAAIDAIIQEEVTVVAALSEENARLRALLSERDELRSIPSTSLSVDQLDPATLFVELQAAKAAQEELALELKTMRESQSRVDSDSREDQSSEVALLRASLADLASELETEKARVTVIETQCREEEEKVAILRSKVEESRRALMRLQGESNKRASVDAATGFSFPTRRTSLLDPSTRRRSSLGLSSIAGSPSLSQKEQPQSGVGLGLDVDSPPPSSLLALSTSPTKTSTATPLARYAHRRGSASISAFPEGSTDDERSARLRDLRLGVTSTKISSRRSSLATGVPDFMAPDDFNWDRNMRRRPSATSRRNRNSICEEAVTDSSGGPPSANLRMLGRNNSMAVFDTWSRRSSSTDSLGGHSGAFLTSAANDEYSLSRTQATNEDLEGLKLQLDGLRIQLAESEEGRRASELCLQALREFIAKSDPSADGTLSLPPMPSDSSVDDREENKRSTSSSLPRWSIPRLSLARRDSVNATPSAPSQSAFSTSFGRRASAASNGSTSTTYLDAKPTSSLASFGSFSFSALVSRSTATLGDGETSPTTHANSTFAPSPRESFSDEPSLSLSASTSSEPDHDHDDSLSHAPSLVSDLSSRSSISSGDSDRSASPVEGSPRFVHGNAGEEDDLVVEAARMPVSLSKSSLTTVKKAVGVAQAL